MTRGAELSMPALAMLLLRLKLARLCLELARLCGDLPSLYRLTRRMVEGVEADQRSAGRLR